MRIDTSGRKRERGSALILSLVVMSLLTGMTLLILGATQTSHLQAVEGEAKSRAELIADSALHLAVVEVARDSSLVDNATERGYFPLGGGEYKWWAGWQDPSGASRLAKEPVIIRVLARVQTSQNGSGGGYQYTEIEARLETGAAEVDAPAAVTLDGQGDGSDDDGDGDAWDDDEGDFHFQHSDHPTHAKIKLGPQARLSGKDHDVDGNVENTLPAKAGASMTTTYREGGSGITDQMDWNTSGGTVEGLPHTQNNGGDLDDELLARIAARAASPDVTLDASSGDVSLGPPNIGTATDPVFLRVNVGDAHEVSFNGGDTGYGILYIEVDDWKPNDSQSALLELGGGSTWKGLVVIRNTGEIDVRGNQSAIVRINGAGGRSTITGGLAFLAEGKWDFNHEPTANVLDTNGQGEFLFSSAALSEYAGVALGDPSNLALVARRVLTRGQLTR